MPMTNATQPRLLFLVAAWLVVVALAVTTLVIGRSFLIPLAVSLIVWYLMNGLARAVRRLGFGKYDFPYWLCMAVSILLFIAFFVLVGNLVAINIGAVAESATAYEQNFQALMAKFAGLFGLEQVPTIDSLVNRMNIGDLISQLAGALSEFIADAGLVLAYVLFLLFEQTVFDRKLRRFVNNPEREDGVRTVLARISKEIETYLWIKTITSAATAIISYAVLIWVGVDYAAFWGLLIFLLAYIPTIGSLLGIVFPALLTLLQFGDWQPFLTVLVPLAVTQILIGNVIEPRMMGNSLNLSPLVVMVSLVLWSMLWGVPGAFLCVPITVIFLIVCMYVPHLRRVAVLLSSDGALESVPRHHSKILRTRPGTGPRPANHSPHPTE
jgi:predicted PurR-regulated permease PerM